MRVSIILSTYNQPQWLEKVLWGYAFQTYSNFEIIIADDGSGPETFKVIKRFREESGLCIKHVWHRDRGYQKCRILNKAVKSSETEYLIFSDGDCIPHRNFVMTHVTNATEQTFLSGGAIRLPKHTSLVITQTDIKNGNAFDVYWLIKHGLPDNPLKNLKLVSTEHGFDRLLNSITPAKATWNGGNASTWKSHILEANGFDERMLYGGQDREFGERLINMGIKGKQLRYSAICVHLDHSRAYKNTTSIEKNLAIRKETRELKKTWTEKGIVETPFYVYESKSDHIRI
ncbi:MAG TPA: glycosyltransferase family 2 protein [Ohtaekwangia sp.]|nr:glycosyltransferase family 2 protein [Ohtaekwangia sp.]